MKEIIVGDDTWTRTDGQSDMERHPSPAPDGDADARPPPGLTHQSPRQLTHRAPRAAAHTTRTR